MQRVSFRILFYTFTKIYINTSLVCKSLTRTRKNVRSFLDSVVRRSSSHLTVISVYHTLYIHVWPREEPSKGDFHKDQLVSDHVVKMYIAVRDGRIKYTLNINIKLQRFLNLRYWSTGGDT